MLSHAVVDAAAASWVSAAQQQTEPENCSVAVAPGSPPPPAVAAAVAAAAVAVAVVAAAAAAGCDCCWGWAASCPGAVALSWIPAGPGPAADLYPPQQDYRPACKNKFKKINSKF